MIRAGERGAGQESTHVLWLIKGLGPGGAERLLVSVAAAARHGSFSYEAAYVLPWKSHLRRELEALGVPVHCLDAPHLLDPRWLLRLRRILLTRPFQVLHVHSPLVAALARLTVQTVPSIHRPSLVYTEHNSWNQYRLPTRLLNALTFGLDDAHLAVSEETRQSIWRPWRADVDAVVHGVPLKQVRAKRQLRDVVRGELGFQPDEVVFGTVANHRVHKDYPTLLRAARRVIDAGVAARFLAVGQGPLEGGARAEHDRLGLGDRFLMLGYQPDAVRLLAACDVFTLASTAEGYPVALMEALALGLPVVATAVGGVAEAVRPGREGLLVAPSRPDELAGAMIRVARDHGLRERMAAAALVRGGDYGIEHAVARIEGTYKMVLDSRALAS